MMNLAGRCHTLVATDEGKVFSFGCNILGRERGSQDGPGLVRGLLESEKAVGVAAGEHFSLVVTASGKVRVFENNLIHMKP